jgi:hypothetical protein
MDNASTSPCMRPSKSLRGCRLRTLSRRTAALIGCIACLTEVGLEAQSDFDDLDKYQPGTLQGIINSELPYMVATGKIDYHATSNVASGHALLRVQVRYTGQRRPLSPLRKGLLRDWNNAGGNIPEGAYKSEYLFMEGSNEHWLALVSNLEESMNAVRPGSLPLLFVQYLGNSYPAGEETPSLKGVRRVTWLFVINAFSE